MEKRTFTRQNLYELVWTKPLSVLAKEYQISDNGLRKICKKMQIPLPPMGHWQKVRSGVHVKRIKLPDKYSGKNEVTLDERGLEDNSPVAKYFRLKKEIENDPTLPLKVPEKLSKPDKLIIETRRSLRDEKRCYNPHRGIIASRDSVLNVRVSRHNLSRALRFLDALIKLLRARGHDIIIEYGRTKAVVYGSRIEISVKEKLKYEMYERFGYKDYSAAGVLSVKIEGYRERTWVDDRQPIEDKLPSILAKLEVLGLELQEFRIRNEKLQREREEKERIQREIKERKENEFKRFRNLFIQATMLHKANVLRQYVRTVESYAMGKGDKTEELNSWINWAMNKIAWIDPLINQIDPILDDSYKKILYKEVEDELGDSNFRVT